MRRLKLIFVACIFAGTLAHAQFERKSEIILPISLSEVKGEWINLNNDSLLDILLIGKDEENEIRLAALENTGSDFVFHNLGSSGLLSATYAITDFDHDGMADLVLNGVSQGNAPGTFVFISQGNFSFLRSTNLISLQASLISVIDFNNDGSQEILLAGQATTGPFLRIYEGSNSDYTMVYDTTDFEIQSIQVYDFKNDGRNHLFISGMGSNGAPQSGVLNNRGNFKFDFKPLPGTMAGKSNAGDFNHDGWFDLVVSGKDVNLLTKTIRFENHEGIFVKKDSIENIEADELLVADFNSDGLADLHLLGKNEDGKNSNFITYADHPALLLDTLNLYSQRFGDFERDGDLDFFQVIDSTSRIKLIRLYENVDPKKNERPQQPTSGFAISTYNKTFLYWINTGDDLTPIEALTYDILLARDGGEQLLYPNFGLTNNLHRTTVSHGYQGTTTFGIFNALTDDRYLYYIQSVDNAFNGSQACTGGVIPCFDLERDDLQACLNETVKLGMPESAYWFSLSAGFLGQMDTLSWVASANDTLFAFVPQQVDCSKNKAWAITVNDESISENDTVYFCDDKPVTLRIASGWNSIVWKNKTVLATNQDSLVISFPRPDTIIASGMSSGGCTYQKEFLLIQSKPDLNLDNDYYQIMKGQSITLNASGGESYLWSPAFSLNQPNISNPKATPLQTTAYTVTATDSLGCTSIGTVTVEVKETAFIPNLFTPNGDGKNDEVKVYGITQANSFDFHIYNREGNIVYRTSNLSEAVSTGWDGQHNGIQQPNGLYYWKVNGKDSTGQPLLLNGQSSGSILLVR